MLSGETYVGRQHTFPYGLLNTSQINKRSHNKTGAKINMGKRTVLHPCLMHHLQQGVCVHYMIFWGGRN